MYLNLVSATVLPAVPGQGLLTQSLTSLMAFILISYSVVVIIFFTHCPLLNEWGWMLYYGNEQQQQWFTASVLFRYKSNLIMHNITTQNTWNTMVVSTIN